VKPAFNHNSIHYFYCNIKAKVHKIAALGGQVDVDHLPLIVYYLSRCVFDKDVLIWDRKKDL